MDDNSYLIEGFEKVLNDGLVFSVSSLNTYDNSSILNDEIAVSAIGFGGDILGEVVAVAKRKDLSVFAKYILEIFEIQVVVDYDLIYSELLNVYMGHIITEASKRDITLTLTPPFDMGSFKKPDVYDKVIEIDMDKGIKIKFCVLFKG